jgi:hypothetical protein
MLVVLVKRAAALIQTQHKTERLVCVLNLVLDS